MNFKDNNSHTGSRSHRLFALAFTIVGLLPFAGCVQSVYPWYQDADVVFDGNLAGTWVGVGDEVKGCSVSVNADATCQVRHYDLELLGKTCANLSLDSDKLTAGGQLLQQGQQRFLDFWDDRCDLHTLVKINVDRQTLSLIPMTPEPTEDLIGQKPAKLQGRVEGHTMWPDDVLLTSSSQNLRKFLRAYANDKDLFSKEDALTFHRQ